MSLSRQVLSSKCFNNENTIFHKTACFLKAQRTGIYKKVAKPTLPYEVKSRQQQEPKTED
jgi:hypothetical protein